MTVGRQLNLSKPQFPCLQMAASNSTTYLIVSLVCLSNIKCLAHCWANNKSSVNIFLKKQGKLQICGWVGYFIFLLSQLMATLLFWLLKPKYLESFLAPFFSSHPTSCLCWEILLTLPLKHTWNLTTSQPHHCQRLVQVAIISRPNHHISLQTGTYSLLSTLQPEESPWNVHQIRSLCLQPFVALHLFVK